MTIDAIGELNKQWGVCGFTSALYALYENSPILERPRLSSAASTKTRMIAEIKSFLQQLKADGQIGMLNEIETFTRSFGAPDNDYARFTITDYINRINNAVEVADEDLGNFSIAMPPEAVVAYLKYIGFPRAQLLPTVADFSGKSELVLGLSTTRSGEMMHNGLRHYVYRKGTKIYSWGLQFNGMTDLTQDPYNFNSGPCLIISPQG